MVDSRTYRSWANMKARCKNPRYDNFSRYGGRGITFCSKWAYFKGFVSDMGVRPDGTTLDRIDNDGNYEPNNCRWATRKEQARNRRSNRWVELDGVNKTLYEWADELGLNRTTVTQRINAYGWTPERALRTPVQQNNRRTSL